MLAAGFMNVPGVMGDKNTSINYIIVVGELAKIYMFIAGIPVVHVRLNLWDIMKV